MNTDAARLAVIEQKQQHFEQKQHDLKQNQEDISRDMKETSEVLRKLALDISSLVVNVTHLTNAVEKVHESSSTLREVEIELVNLRAETRTIRKLWNSYDDLKTKVDSQNIVVRAAQVVATAGIVSLIGLALAKMFGGA